MQDDCPAVVALEPEQVFDRRLTRRLIEVLAERQVTFRLRLERKEARVVEPQPLGVGGERLVEPQISPVGRCDGVAEPLVGQFVGQEQFLQDAGCAAREVFPREEDRPCVSMASPGKLSVNASP